MVKDYLAEYGSAQTPLFEEGGELPVEGMPTEAPEELGASAEDILTEVATAASQIVQAAGENVEAAKDAALEFVQQIVSSLNGGEEEAPEAPEGPMPPESEEDVFGEGGALPIPKGTPIEQMYAARQKR